MPTDTVEATGGRVIEVTADKYGLDRGRDFLVETFQSAGYDFEVTFALTTSFLELFENIMRHGYAGNPGKVVIEVVEDGGSVGIKLQDTAAGFDLTAYSDPGQADMIRRGITGKMGIKTIKTLCDSVTYKRDGNINIHVLSKKKRV